MTNYIFPSRIEEWELKDGEALQQNKESTVTLVRYVRIYKQALREKFQANSQENVSNISDSNSEKF